MEVFFCNELSIEQQFVANGPSFEVALLEVWSIQRYLSKRNVELKCRWQISQRLGRPAFSFAELLKTVDRELGRAIMKWLSFDHGLPLDQLDDITDVHVNGQPVGSSVFSDVVFQNFCVNNGTVVSFKESVQFTASPLDIDAKFSGQQHNFNVQNIHTLVQAKALVPEPLPRTWSGYLFLWAEENKNLQFAPYLFDRIRKEPFDTVIADAATRLLSILNELQTHRLASRDARLAENYVLSEQHTKKVNALHEQYFKGTTAKFTDESVNNKAAYKAELTFTNPNGGPNIFCSYHGKISHNFWRIHYSWPIGDNDPLQVVYIGPKITT